MHDAALLVQVTNALSDLDDDMSRKGLAEVRELDDLVEKFTALHHWMDRSLSACWNDVDQDASAYIRGRGSNIPVIRRRIAT